MSNSKVTQVGKQQQIAAACKQQVMELLGWDELTYCEYKYEQGLAYMQTYLEGDTRALRILERSATYWGWWKLHWTIREQQSMAAVAAEPTVKLRRMEYERVHGVMQLAHEVYEEAKGLSRSFENILEIMAKTGA
jgi:hypothetical protein